MHLQVQEGGRVAETPLPDGGVVFGREVFEPQKVRAMRRARLGAAVFASVMLVATVLAIVRWL
jgi:hypothetical protein